MRHGSLLAVILIWLSSTALAHKINAFAYLEDGHIHVEGYFPDGKKAKGAKVTVTNAKGETVAQGKADDEGIFQAPLPQGDLGAVLNLAFDAGLGHRTEAQISMADEAASVSPENTPLQGAKRDIDERALRKQIELAVTRAIVPLERRIAAYEQSTGVREIAGGIGYLLGLFGLTILVQNWKKNVKTTEPSATPKSD